MTHSTRLNGHVLDADAARLLRYLHRSGNQSYYTTFDTNGYARQVWFASDAEPPAAPTERNLYFGVNPCTGIPATSATTGKPVQPANARASKDYIAALNCLYAEFDAKDFVVVTDDEAKAEQASGGGKLHEARERIQKRTADAEYKRYTALALVHVLALAVQPSVIVASGGGYHCYWLLAEPFVLDTDETRERAVVLQRDWVTFVRGDKAAKDIARVLRVPGTLNTKYNPPRPVTFVEQDYSRLFTLDALQATLPANAPRTARTPKQNAPACNTDGLQPNAEHAPVDFMAVSKAAAAMARLSTERRDEYNGWINVGMALRELDDVGYSMWHAWSMASPKYNVGECAGKWRTFRAGTPGGTDITLASLYRYADEDGPLIQDETGSTLDENERRQLAALKARDVRQQRIMNSNMPLSAKGVINAMLPYIETGSILVENKDGHSGSVSVNYGNFAAIMKTSKTTVARAIDIGEQAGLWHKDAEYKETNAGYDVKVVSLNLQPVYYGLEPVHPIEQKQHGGARRGAGRKPKCQTCPPGTPMLEQTETVRRTTCTGCHKVLAEETFYTERTVQPDAFIQDETGTPLATVETNAEPMHAEPVAAAPTRAALDAPTAEPIQDETVVEPYVYTVSCLKKALDEAGMTAALQLADTYAPVDATERATYKTGLVWVQRGEHDKAAAAAANVHDERARVALLHLANHVPGMAPA
jgi:hypothetical protein